MTQEEIKNLNSPIYEKNEKKLLTMTATKPDGLTGELNQTLKKVVLCLAWQLMAHICMCLHQDF